MENKTNETIIEGRKFRRLIDKKTNTWGRTSGWITTDRPFRKAIPISINNIQKEK